MKNLKINVPEGYEIDRHKSTFETIVFKKKNELPTSWYELETINGYYVDKNSCVLNPELDHFAHSANRNMFKTKEQAEACVALAQLSQLRDVYRQGWEPDWLLYSNKYCVDFNGNCPDVSVHSFESKFISFQYRETAELFLNNFRDLIEQAKPLMS